MAKSLEDMTVPELVAHARQAGEKSQLLDTLLANPATRKEALKLVKQTNPSMPIPELDAEAAAAAQIAEERTAREASDKRIRELEIRESIGAERKRIKDSHGLTDADMIEVEKIMTDKDAPIAHYDAAVKVYKASKVLATPTSGNIEPPTYDMPSKDIWKGGIGRPAELTKIATKQAYEALAEIKSGKVVGA